MNRIILKDIPKFETIQEHARRFPDIDPTALMAMINLLYTSDQLAEALDIHFNRNNISKGRFMILMLLKRYQETPLSPSELAEKASCTRATMTGLLDGLEQDELIIRKPNIHDRRGYTIELTDKADQFMKTMLPDHFRRISKLMVHLSEQERYQLVELLQKVCAGMSALKNETY